MITGLALMLSASFASANTYKCVDSAGHVVIRQDDDRRETKSFQDDDGSIFLCHAKETDKHVSNRSSSHYLKCGDCPGHQNWTPCGRPINGAVCMSGIGWYPNVHPFPF